MEDWLSNRSEVEKLICGAVKAAIHAHGPITVDNAASAAKRVYGELKAYRRLRAKDAVTVENEDETKVGYVLCEACSRAGAADRGVYHEPPVCPISEE